MVKYHELRAEKINLHAPEVQRIKLGDGKEKEKKKPHKTNTRKENHSIYLDLVLLMVTSRYQK